MCSRGTCVRKEGVRKEDGWCRARNGDELMDLRATLRMTR